MLLDMYRLDKANLDKDRRSKSLEQCEGIMHSRKTITLLSDKIIMNLERVFI